MIKILLLLMVIVLACDSQHVKSTYDDSVAICWSVDSGCTSIVYQKAYDSDGAVEIGEWKTLGATTDTFLRVYRNGLQSVIFGVRSFYQGDTSEMHTTLDSTACITDSDNQCLEQGWWVLKWSVLKPKLLKLIRFRRK